MKKTHTQRKNIIFYRDSTLMWCRFDVYNRQHFKMGLNILSPIPEFCRFFSMRILTTLNFMKVDQNELILSWDVLDHMLIRIFYASYVTKKFAFIRNLQNSEVFCQNSEEFGRNLRQNLQISLEFWLLFCRVLQNILVHNFIFYIFRRSLFYW